MSISSIESSASSDLVTIDLSPSEKCKWMHMAIQPNLPLPVTATTKRTSKRTMAAKFLASICMLIILWQCLTNWKATFSRVTLMDDIAAANPADLTVSTVLPDYPTALIVADIKGSSKWTISIPHNRRFPLAEDEYRDMCSHGEMLRDQINRGRTSAKMRDWLTGDGRFMSDTTFIQIDEAIEHGALPRSRRENSNNVCDKSLTFVLDRDDASLGKSLLLLWMSYGLAKKEGRAFFIDDSQWAWGKYASYFLPPPPPRCMKPPPHHIVPCPHNAKHLVVSSATAGWTFGSHFDSHFVSSVSRGLEKQSRIYELLRAGYEDLFKLKGEDLDYASARVARLASDAAETHEPVIGMQIRRGDLHPFEYQYNMDYLPVERYAEGVNSYLHRLYPITNPSPSVTDLKTPLVLASDDPEIYTHDDLRLALGPFHVQRAQERIMLASKSTLDQQKPERDAKSAYTKHVDENSGWEGGFYSSLFFSLGGGRSAGVRSKQTEEALRLREFVGRAYLMDLEVLSHSDGMICAISSASCRALGVMMGWDALKQGRWVNVDDNRIWSWDGRKL